MHTVHVLRLVRCNKKTNAICWIKLRLLLLWWSTPYCGPIGAVSWDSYWVWVCVFELRPVSPPFISDSAMAARLQFKLRTSVKSDAVVISAARWNTEPSTEVFLDFLLQHKGSRSLKRILAAAAELNTADIGRFLWNVWSWIQSVFNWEVCCSWVGGPARPVDDSLSPPLWVSAMCLCAGIFSVVTNPFMCWPCVVRVSSIRGGDSLL